MRLGFVGDINFSGSFREVDSVNFVSKSVRALLESCDYVVGNIEGPITSRSSAVNAYKINLKSDSSMNKILHGLNINVWNLANNHINDFGWDAVMDTVRGAENMGIKTFGIREQPYTILTDSKTGERVALVALMQYFDAADFHSYLLTNKKEKEVLELIEKLKERCEKIILNYHGFEEYVTYPMKAKYDFFERILESGVSMIVGHHPHVPQGFKVGDNGISIFSLGNFIFDIEQHRSRMYTDIGQILVVDIDQGSFEFELVPVKMYRFEGILDLTNECELPLFSTDIGRFRHDLWEDACYNLLFVENRKFLKQGIRLNTALGFLKYINRYRRLLWSYYKGREAYRPVLIGALRSLIFR